MTLLHAREKSLFLRAMRSAGAANFLGHEVLNLVMDAGG